VKKNLVIIILAAFCMVFVSCSKKEEPVKEEVKQEEVKKEEVKKDYVVGAFFAITGKFASLLGEPERNTVEMMVKQVNEAGGINGHKLVVHMEDTQGDNSRAVKAAKKFIGMGVCAIVGPSRSGSSMAVIPVVQKAKIPLISCAAAESIVVPVAERKYIFKTPQKDSDAVRKIYGRLNKKGVTDVGIITGTTGFGNAGRGQLKTLAGEYKINIVADETYSPADTDMTAQLVKIKNAGAKAVINWSIVPAQSIVPKNMKQLKMDIPLYQSHGFGNIKYAKLAGDAAEGIMFPGGRLLVAKQLIHHHPQRPLLMKYKEDYESTYNEDASTFGGHAYDALLIVINALKAVGDDPEKIRDHIETQNFFGTGGNFKFTPEDHNGLNTRAFDMITVSFGEFKILGEW
jgi:branched-chain amino acid transport system substrate-binding protein